jgi:hypothetical protein
MTEWVPKSWMENFALYITMFGISGQTFHFLSLTLLPMEWQTYWLYERGREGCCAGQRNGLCQAEIPGSGILARIPFGHYSGQIKTNCTGVCARDMKKEECWKGDTRRTNVATSESTMPLGSMEPKVST